MSVDFTDTKSELDMEQELLNLLDEHSDCEGVAHAYVFGDTLLTRNKGVVVRLANGAEFQLTIVQSRHHDGFMDDEEGDDDED